MVEPINELSELSGKLNQKSDKTNSIIDTINKKLAALNFGLEVWLDDAIESGDLQKTYRYGQQSPLPRELSVTSSAPFDTSEVVGARRSSGATA